MGKHATPRRRRPPPAMGKTSVQTHTRVPARSSIAHLGTVGCGCNKQDAGDDSRTDRSTSPQCNTRKRHYDCVAEARRLSCAGWGYYLLGRLHAFDCCCASAVTHREAGHRTPCYAVDRCKMARKVELCCCAADTAGVAELGDRWCNHQRTDRVLSWAPHRVSMRVSMSPCWFGRRSVQTDSCELIL